MTEVIVRLRRRVASALAVAVVLILAAPTARGESASSAKPDSSCVPPGWRVKDMAAAGLQQWERLEEARVLRWRVIEDDRPLRVESAIIWVRAHRWGGHKPFWILAHVYRHPDETRPPAAWRTAHLFDVDSFRGRTVHAMPPKAAAVDSLRQVSAWGWGMQGFRTLAGGNCVDAWREVIGVDPPEDAAGP